MTELVDTYWLYFLVGQYPHGPLGGLALTVVLATLGLVLALPLGVLLGLARFSPNRWLRLPVTAWVWVVRGTPLLMVVFWAYFFLPTVTGRKTDQFSTMLIALIVFDAAYLAEIVHAGLQALPRGQLQAAMSLGMTRSQTLRSVLLPQALRHMLPSLINQFVAIIKETSLGTIIGLSELSFIANQINAQVLVKPVEIYLTLAGCYFAMCFGLTCVARVVEGRLAR
ncbi:polar amino acid transport system permease protein [Pelomonas saccharophila]|uniref:Polar amino acid transport system permease protein n=1 Tax=Roseateles saccharophilus TaxID=304 RepID=A0ABU1YJM6_ROSSA|nr:amino acid ABC transporter permease [Roseateles saccharophilus]MDR7269058.1 polar amino acid transport system permease protein [Roseateles saccharophilus]